jgi:multidrug efflux pump subunit AcrB
MGKSPYRAAMEGADEIGLAVIAITLTIVAIFAPVSFMGGIPGQYFKQFGLTVAVTVLFSLLVARLLTPMMAAYLMRPHPARPDKDSALMRAYTGFLRVTLRFRYLTLLVGMGLFASSIWSTSLLPTGFIPSEDAARSVISLELPPGATLADTARTTDVVARILKSMPEVRSVFTMGGTSPMMGGTTPTGASLEVRRATLLVMLTPKKNRELSQKRVEGDISRRLADVPDIRAWYVNERGQRELSITVMGNDGPDLSNAVALLEAAMRREPGFANAAASAGLDRPEIRVVPRLDEAARHGVSPETISETVRVATIGDADANLAKFNAGDRQIPIRVQLEETARNDLKLIEILAVPAAGGMAIPLISLADVTFGQGPSSIERFDRERRVLIGADLVGGMTLGDAVEKVKALSEARSLPPADGAGCPGSSVPQRLPTGHDPAVAAALDRRRIRGIAADRQRDQHAGGDRHPDADGHRDEERDHAGRFRDGAGTQGRIPDRSGHRRRPQARPAHRDDNHRDGGRHAPQRPGSRRRRRVPLPHGDRGDRWPAGVHIAVADLRAQLLHDHGRPVQVLRPPVWPLHRPQGGRDDPHVFSRLDYAAVRKRETAK